MDRITHQPPRPQGYGSTSSLRNDSLKHTRKHKRRKGGIEPKSKTARLWWTVRPGRADCPHRPRGLSGRYRGLSAPVPRTVRPRAADRPLNPTEPPVANPEKRTVRGEHADCPPGTRGLSARHTRTVRNLDQRKLKATTDRKRRRTRTRRTHDEHCACGPSARPLRTVREARTELKTARPRKSTLPIHHRISQPVEAVETRVWGHEKRQPRMLYPKNFAS
jgi:hypothetical protein